MGHARKTAAGQLAIRSTASLLERFSELRIEITDLANAEDVDEFIQQWLPPNAQTELLAEAVARCRREAATIQELYDALYATITEPEVPLEVTEVRLMSLHKSKGLSSPFVFIVGCVEGLLPGRPGPSQRPDDRIAKLQEDRRLFYVGITRVKAVTPAIAGYLALTYPQTMPAAEAYASQIVPAKVVYGVAHLQPSRFFERWRLMHLKRSLTLRYKGVDAPKHVRRSL